MFSALNYHLKGDRSKVLRAYFWHVRIALEWIPTLDNKRPEWYSLKDRSVIKWIDYKWNSVGSAIFYYFENKQKSGNILMPLEVFKATTSFICVFELCTIMHKVSLPVSQSHRNGNQPENHATHIFNLPWTHLWKLFLIIASFSHVRNDLLC